MGVLGTLTRLEIGPLWRLRDLPHEGRRSLFAEVPNAPGTVQPVAADALMGGTVGENKAWSADDSLAIEAPRTTRIWNWQQLDAVVRDCRACRLCEARKQAVLGVGDQQADWLFVGEGPGAEEDLRGEPFVGQAGKLLDAMLASLGIARGNRVYIANAVKCRPPNNRTPEPDEIEACFPYLQRQIELIQPRVIVALGRPAAQALLKQEVRIGAARGQVFRFGETPVVVTYHPAYLLRNPADKGKAWADLCFAKKALESSPPKAVAPG